MTERMEQLRVALQGNDMEVVDIKVAHIPELDLNHFSKTAVAKENSEPVEARKEAPEDSDAYQVQTTRLYRIAETFIRAVKEIYK